MSVFERVQKVVADRLGLELEEVKVDSDFKNDLGADSLDVVELVMELEDEFDIEVSDEAAETLNTVNDVVKFIETHS